jgi:hypothetical protein
MMSAKGNRNTARQSCARNEGWRGWPAVPETPREQGFRLQPAEKKNAIRRKERAPCRNSVPHDFAKDGGPK